MLYQLLGGHLPYDEISWLSKAERKHFNLLSSNADKSIFVDQCVKSKIKKGTLLDLKSLPPWVTDNLRRTIRKATHTNPDKRFSTASSFHIHLHNMLDAIPDWTVNDGYPTLNTATAYRICENDVGFYIQKSKAGGAWRKDNSFNVTSVGQAVQQINEKS